MARKANTTNLGMIGLAAARSASLFAVDEGRSYRELSLAQIHANAAQPRTRFDAEALQELAWSIEQHGVLQPILVREISPDSYEIIAGERRFRACELAEQMTIPAIVMVTEDAGVLALLENIQREDLDPFDLARFLQRLLLEHGATHEQLATLIGKSRPYVTRVLGLLRLPPLVMEECRDQPQISLSLLMEIAEAEDEALQMVLWDQAKLGTTVKALRRVKQNGGKLEEAEQEDAKAKLVRTAPTEPLLRNSHRLSQHLDRLKQKGQPLNDVQAAALRALRERIDSLLK